MGQTETEELLDLVPTTWRIAPGDRAYLWDKSFEGGYITINWLCDLDYRSFESEAELLEYLKADSGKSNQTSAKDSIWTFTHRIQPGHLVVANRGTREVVGIGIVRSDYIPPQSPDNPRKGLTEHLHVRRVDWHIHESWEWHENAWGNRVPPAVAPLSREDVVWWIEEYLRGYPDQANSLIAALKGDRNAGESEDATRDIMDVAADPNLSATEKQRLTDARLGQGRFRREVLDTCDGRCAVTGATTLSAIRASHIKPWCESNNSDRLDCENGIPLVATLDALFDKGLISFDDAGAMLVSEKLDLRERELLGVGAEARIEVRSARMAENLKWHRKRFGFDA